MSQITQETVSRNVLTRTLIAEMLGKNFTKLPDVDQKFFVYGPVFLGGYAGLTGLISNSFYRRALNVKQAVITSGMPMAVLPFLTTFAMYNATVSNPLMSGDLNCSSCALLRGAAVGVLSAGVYPILLALPVNIGLASRYSTSLLPEKGNVLRFCVDISKPILRKMRAVLVLHAIFGTYLGSRHFDTYTKLVEITFSSSGEDIED